MFSLGGLWRGKPVKKTNVVTSVSTTTYKQCKQQMNRPVSHGKHNGSRHICRIISKHYAV